MDTLIQVENLSKKFCYNLKRSMIYAASDSLRGFVRVKPETSVLRKEEFLALDNLSFSLKRGEKLGIIGLNGSGKSTLLRVLTGIFPPDSGKVTVSGSVGALIAVGAGFHPHMTGRENIYLNGTILGMSREEIDTHIDSIISFAELGDFMGAPVSTYSSGMRVRLGFSIAVHVQPEILILDEVLSVGDESFKLKSMTKLMELTNNCGTIFVSHSMRDMYRLCDRVMWLDKGKIIMLGSPGEVINKYLSSSLGKISSEGLVLKQAEFMKGVELNLADEFYVDGDIEGDISLQSLRDVNDVIFIYTVFSNKHDLLSEENTQEQNINIRNGFSKLSFKVNETKLSWGEYYVVIKAKTRSGGLVFEVRSKSFSLKSSGEIFNKTNGFFHENVEWKYE
jgi:lipopolysaccharide transport system ATP-binding protein